MSLDTGSPPRLYRVITIVEFLVSFHKGIHCEKKTDAKRRQALDIPQPSGACRLFHERHPTISFAEFVELQGGGCRTVAPWSTGQNYLFPKPLRVSKHPANSFLNRRFLFPLADWNGSCSERR